MTDLSVDRFAAASRTQRTVLLARAENRLPPRDFLDLGRRLAERDPDLGAAFAERDSARTLSAVAPEPYRRSELAPHVDLYADPTVPAADKTLLVAFATTKGRMLIPNVVFLQALPARHFDVLLLSDPNADHFAGGLAGFADDLPGLVGAVARAVEPGRYRRHMALGASMGGFPAIRYAIIAGADRAVALSGLPAWQVNRLQSGRGTEAYDPICPCTRARCPDIRAVHAARNRKDREAAALLAARCGARVVPVRGLDDHNVVAPHWQRGRLRHFLAAQLDFDPRPDLPAFDTDQLRRLEIREAVAAGRPVPPRGRWRRLLARLRGLIGRT